MGTTRALALVVTLATGIALPQLSIASGQPAPEFTHKDPDAWINSEPLTLSQLRGQVVLVDFWTFDCWNCYRSFPWLNSVEERFKEEDFRIIGVHSPEFDHERQRHRVEAKVREFELQHPVMMDNDFSYWRAMENRYWPAFYLIDQRGIIRDTFVGETHTGDPRAKAIEASIEALLMESSKGKPMPF